MPPKPPATLDDAEVVLVLDIEVAEANRLKLFDFCRQAFPVYESVGGNKMALYEDKDHAGHFFEVGYYATKADYDRSERAVKDDPAQSALIREWKALLKAPPKVTVSIRQRVDQTAVKGS